jgi:hypothetical protein
MQKVLAVLFAGLMLAGAACAETVRSAPQAYAGVAAASTDRTGGSGKLNPKVFGGYAFNDTLAVEAGYIDLRKATPAPEARTIDLGGFGTYVAARFTKPLMDKLSAYGKLGIAQSERKLSTAGVMRKDTDTGLYGAFGLQYSITKKVALTAEYERYGKDKKVGAKADTWSFGLNFGF